MNVKITKTIKCFEGQTLYAEHESTSTQTKMIFSAFIPKSERVDHAIIWLSGLTCTEENFITKAGAQKLLSDSNTMLICPDTSPRGLTLPKEHDSYDFGSGAGFYVNATHPDYINNYRMYDYIKKDIVSILKQHFNVSHISIMGHSMGGHGALVLALKEPDLFQSVSAFSPIVNPLQCPWGKKAFTGYLKEPLTEGKAYDATELILSGKTRPDKLFIDQGLDDPFLKEQLLTENLNKACKENNQAIQIHYREGYDHSYFYIASFIEQHLRFHMKN